MTSVSEMKLRAQERDIKREGEGCIILQADLQVYEWIDETVRNVWRIELTMMPSNRLMIVGSCIWNGFWTAAECQSGHYVFCHQTQLYHVSFSSLIYDCNVHDATILSDMPKYIANGPITAYAMREHISDAMKCISHMRFCYHNNLP